MYALQDWSTEDWTRALACDDDNARLFCAAFVPDGDWTDKSTLAQAIKTKIDKPMELYQTRALASFQNDYMNREHKQHKHALTRYPHPTLLSNAVFNREFPLGMEEFCMENVDFAVENSGLGEISHERSSCTTCAVYSSMIICLCGVGGYLLMLCTRPSLWSLNATIQYKNDTDFSRVLNERTRERGTFASLVCALLFSSTVNSTLDKFGRIDPSTSTVLIGMTLGGTFGFMLDCMFGSDEGFREYLWSPMGGMRYALGSLATNRFARYLVTILFDMFFTVILFKKMYPLMLRLSGFSERGREWIANAFVSGIIAISTYQVYANMVRFEWAYPSGHEDVMNQWISGPTMILSTVIMCMVYLVSETRTRWGEPGINDPRIKIAVTAATFGFLAVLQMFGIMDPSGEDLGASAFVDERRWEDVHMPLKGVCKTKSLWVTGSGILVAIVVFSIGFTIFVTSRLHLCARPVVFVFYCALTLGIVSMFAFVPLFSAGVPRRDDVWGDACARYDRAELARLGLL